MKRIFINLVPMSLVGIVCLSTVVNAQTTRSSNVATISTASAGDEPAVALPVGQTISSVAVSSGDEPNVAVAYPQLSQHPAATAFGYGFKAATTAELPVLMLHSEVSEKERQDLTEDLQVLEALLEKAVSVTGSRPNVDNRVLGVRVHRSSLPASISYLEGFGIQFRMQTSELSFAKSTESKVESGDTKEETKETDWDVARRELQADRNGKVAVGFGSVQEVPSVRHDEKNVETIIEQVTKALDNIGRIRFPASAVGTKQIVSVCLTCPADGSVLSIRKSIQCAADPKESTLDAVTTYRYADPAAKNSESASQQYLLSYPAAATIPRVNVAVPPRATRTIRSAPVAAVETTTPLEPAAAVEPVAPTAPVAPSSATSPAPTPRGN